jgi:peptidoglycan/xylan/chitin deacetylase (PgdA/CDA1 family)
VPIHRPPRPLALAVSLFGLAAIGLAAAASQTGLLAHGAAVGSLLGPSSPAAPLASSAVIPSPASPWPAMATGGPPGPAPGSSGVAGATAGGASAAPGVNGAGGDLRPGPEASANGEGGLTASSSPVPSPVAGFPFRPTEGLLPVTARSALDACGPPLPPDPAHPLVLHVPILMYHRVQWPALARDALPSLVVPPDRFTAQLAALAQAGWRTITVADLARLLAEGRRPGPRTLAISFDDGFADGYTVALPILRRFGDVATFYVVTGRLGEADHLSGSDVRALAAAGMEIGDHTVGHLDLARLSPDRLHYQVERSAERIRALTGSSPITFAYPYGDCSPAVVAELQRDGFLLAVTNREGVGEAWPWRYAVPRIRVGPSTSPADLLARLAPYR